MPRRRDTDELHRRDRIVAVKPIGAIAEGTTGMVKAIVGQTWTRYLVRWDDGEWTGTVDPSTIVRTDRLDIYKQRQAELAKAAAAPKAGGAAAGGAAASEGGAGGGRIPEYLVERSRAARARLTGG